MDVVENLMNYKIFYRQNADVKIFEKKENFALDPYNIFQRMENSQAR